MYKLFIYIILIILKYILKKNRWRRKGTRLLYPTSNPTQLRQVGVDLNLQERLDDMFKEEHDKIAAKKIDIGFPVPKSSK